MTRSMLIVRFASCLLLARRVQADGGFLRRAAHRFTEGDGCNDRRMAQTESSCLCVFDIDRTLTGRQSDTEQCPENIELDLYDEGYGGGNATLSELAAQGINSTFCNDCLLGICSAGHGSGPNSSWNAYVMDNIVRGNRHDAFLADHPESKVWSFGEDVRSPYVLNQRNKIKHIAVELIRQWYGAADRSICIPRSSVFFFGDHTENILPFAEVGHNSREISCGSRDRHVYWNDTGNDSDNGTGDDSDNGTGNGTGIGYCGATPQEVVNETGNILCESFD